MTAPTRPQYEIRAQHTDTTVTVYQAYSPLIGVPAVRDGRFPEAWKRDRMTWIKPSYLWMMYRCGWALKEGQETVLAVEITREGFDWALEHAELSHYVRESTRTAPPGSGICAAPRPASSGTPSATCVWTGCRTAPSSSG